MFNTIVDIFSRAQNNKALTPNERAIIKAMKGAVIGVLIDILPQINNMVANHQSFSITQAGISALACAFILALLKLWSAQSDVALSPILDALAMQKERETIDSLSAPDDGSIPAWQITIPIQATASRVTMPVTNKAIMVSPPIPTRASSASTKNTWNPPLYTLGVPTVQTPLSKLSVPPDPHDMPTDIVPAVNAPQSS